MPDVTLDIPTPLSRWRDTAGVCFTVLLVSELCSPESTGIRLVSAIGESGQPVSLPLPQWQEQMTPLLDGKAPAVWDAGAGEGLARRGQAVYRHKATGDLYAETDLGVSRKVDLAGTRFVSLERVRRLLDLKGLAAPEGNPSTYQPLRRSHELIVTRTAFTEGFELLPDRRAVQNTPVSQLQQQFAAEECDFGSLPGVVALAQRLVVTMGDSQARCLLHVLTNVVAPVLAAAQPAQRSAAAC